LLRACRERPRDRRAAQCEYEFSPSDVDSPAIPALRETAYEFDRLHLEARGLVCTLIFFGYGPLPTHERKRENRSERRSIGFPIEVSRERKALGLSDCSRCAVMY
jgi:hypothetical protein